MDNPKSFLTQHKQTKNVYKVNAKRATIENESLPAAAEQGECSTGALDDSSAYNVEPQLVEEATDDTDDDFFNEIISIEEVSDSSEGEAVEASQRASMFRDMSMAECIQYLAITKNLPHSTVNVLLQILKEKTPHSLPKDARSLLKTNRTVSNIQNIEGGQFWYRGVRSCLMSRLRNVTVPEVLSLNISIDGLPLHKSGPATFWPILINIHEMPAITPMVVAIFSGVSKPPRLEEYLRPLITELNELVDESMVMNNILHMIKVRAIIADAPARAFIKGVAYFNGVHGCMKCTCEGVFSAEARTVVFKGINSLKRTDELFRMRAYGEHHKLYSPLIDLKYFNIIEDVIVADALHLLHLGMMRKLLKGWMFGKLAARKWSRQQIEKISRQLLSCKLPSEFHRKFRKLDYIKFWKGSELSAFLHYASIVVLKDVISEEAFNHFLLLYCGVTLLSSNVYSSYWKYAGTLLNQFVQQFETVYGEMHMTSNVHNLQHMYDEVDKFGNLNTLSSYPFENALQYIKKFLRSGYRSLEQVINRLSEQEHFEERKSAVTSSNQTNFKRKGIDVEVVLGNFMLRKGFRDAWFLTKCNNIIQYVTANETSPVTIIGKMLSIKNEYFTSPISSTGINICISKIQYVSEHAVEIKVEEIKCKLVAIKFDDNDKYLFVPVLHTLVEE